MEKGSIVLLHRRDSLGAPFTQESAFVVGEVPDGLNLLAFKPKEAAHLSGPDWPLAFERLSGIRHLGHPDVLAGRVHSFYSEIEDAETDQLSVLRQYLYSNYPSIVAPNDTPVDTVIRIIGVLEKHIDGLDAQKAAQVDPTQAQASPTPTGRDSSEPSESTAASGQSTAPGETVQPPAETATS